MTSSVIDFVSNTLLALFHFLTASAFRPLPASPTNLENQKMKDIVIVGGSFSAVGTTHRIFQKAAKTPNAPPFKITLVSRDSHFYWNLAATRATVQGKLSDDEIFRPIAGGFAQYGAKFEFVLGSATGLDAESKTLQVTVAGDGGQKSISYDVLILATGTHSKVDSPYKSRGSTEVTKEALHQLQARVEAAKTIVVAGAGATGVELAGELADGYGKSKNIVLLTGSNTILHDRPLRMANTAAKYLGILGVDVRVNSKVERTNELPDGKTELHFASGDKLTTDVYIATYGVVPNSSYLPKDMLNERGFIKVDDFLSVKGAKDVYAIGEVSDCELLNFMFLEAQSKHMANNAVLIASGKQPLAYKKSSTRMMGVSVGKNYATGHYNSFLLPGFVLTRVRKVLFVDWLPGRVDGSGY